MKKDLLYVVIAIVVIAGICFGLAKMRPDWVPSKLQSSSVDQSGAPKPMTAGKVVMHVNGEPVTDEQFQTYVNGMPENMQQMAQMPQGRRLLADQISSLIALS